VDDTGTALSIQIPGYENGPTLYATMLSKPFPENEDWDAPERKIGAYRNYVIFHTEGDFVWKSYVARSAEWQLSLIIYPGVGNDGVDWPQGTVNWLRRAVEKVENSPPQCSGPII
jgi:hypothetical protein